MTLFCTQPLVPLLSSRMECLYRGCIWRGRAGIRKLPVWWRQSPCSWSVPCPPSTSNLWRAARGSPRVSTQSYTHPCVTKSSLLNSAVKCKSVLSVIVDVLVCVCADMYSCPCYYYPVRSGGTGRPSFVVAVDLKSGAVPYDHWVKRGTALLMSLDN